MVDSRLVQIWFSRADVIDGLGGYVYVILDCLSAPQVDYDTVLRISDLSRIDDISYIFQTFM